MELHEIRYFLALSKTLNFTKAAEMCNVSQPALTRAIQKMEDELGGLLFSRERNNTHLTELGRMLEPHLTEVLTRTQAAKETANRFLRLDSAQLKLGVMCTIGPVRFVSFLSCFRADNPGVEITLTEAVPNRLCDLLTKGELDVALIARPDGFASPLQPQPLYRERFVIACSAGHPFARKNSVSVAELDGQPYLARINCEYLRYAARHLPRQWLPSGRSLPQRARGLDSDNGRRRHGCLLSSGILQHDTRRDQPSGYLSRRSSARYAWSPSPDDAGPPPFRRSFGP